MGLTLAAYRTLATMLEAFLGTSVVLLTLHLL